MTETMLWYGWLSLGYLIGYTLGYWHGRYRERWYGSASQD